MAGRCWPFVLTHRTRQWRTPVCFKERGIRLEHIRLDKPKHGARVGCCNSIAPNYGPRKWPFDLINAVPATVHTGHGLKVTNGRILRSTSSITCGIEALDSTPFKVDAKSAAIFEMVLRCGFKLLMLQGAGIGLPWVWRAAAAMPTGKQTGLECRC